MSAVWPPQVRRSFCSAGVTETCPPFFPLQRTWWSFCRGHSCTCDCGPQPICWYVDVSFALCGLKKKCFADPDVGRYSYVIHSWWTQQPKGFTSPPPICCNVPQRQRHTDVPLAGCVKRIRQDLLGHTAAAGRQKASGARQTPCCVRCHTASQKQWVNVSCAFQRTLRSSQTGRVWFIYISVSL